MKRPLVTLELPRVVISDLRKAGFRYYEDLFDRNQEFMKKAVQILTARGLTWCQVKQSTEEIPAFLTASHLLKCEKQKQTIPTFSEAVDDVLGGGIGVPSLLQVCGPPGSGKTQLLMQACVAVQMPANFGSLSGHAVFIDSERGFTKERLQEMGEAAVEHCARVASLYDLESEVEGLSVSSVLANVHYMEITGHTQLLASIQIVKHYLRSHPQVRLIVFDSLIMPLLGLSQFIDRTRLVTNIIRELHTMSKQFNVAVVFSNDLTTQVTGDDTRCLVPALGTYLTHLTPNVLLLSRMSSDSQSFVAFPYKSSSCKPCTASFCILKEGIRDLTD